MSVPGKVILVVRLRESPEERVPVAVLPVPSATQSGVFAKRTAPAATRIRQRSPERSGQRKSGTPVKQSSELPGHNME